MRAFNLLGITLLVLLGFCINAEEPSETIEPSESNDSIKIQPNGYFEFPTENHFNEELVTYGDLVDLVVDLAKEKLQATEDKKDSQTDGTKASVATSNEEPAPSRADRTWKRRILVLLNGKRVTSTADRNMKIEEHVGISLDNIESLEGFLSTEVDSNQIVYPRVLNFVTKPPTQDEGETPESRDTNIELLKDGNPQAGVRFNLQT